MLQNHHIICWRLNNGGEAGDKPVSRKEREKDSCHFTWCSQSFVETIIRCKFLFTSSACTFISTDANISNLTVFYSFHKSICLWLLWLFNPGVQNVFTFFIIFLLFFIYQNILSSSCLGLIFCFSSKTPEELNSLWDYLGTVFIPWVYLQGTKQGPTLRVHDF